MCTESGTNIPNRMHANESRRYVHVGLGGNSLQCPQMFVVLMRKDIIMSEMVVTCAAWLNLTYCLSLCSFCFVSFHVLELASVDHLATFMKFLNTIAPVKNNKL